MNDLTRGKSPRKGGLKSPLQIGTLINLLLTDLCASYGLPIDEQDKATVSRRLDAEGARFACVTLKSIQDSLFWALEYGMLPAESPFSVVPGTRTPKFLRGLWSLLVDHEGRLLPEQLPGGVDAVRALLQVATCFSKYEEAVPLDLIPQYLAEFVAVDQGLADVDLSGALLSVSANVITHVFSEFSLAAITPKHGPGSVATGESDEQKWSFKRIIATANQFYPFYDYFVTGQADMERLEKAAWLLGLEKQSSGTAKLLFVPKTSTSLRTISMEPLELQFLQQGQMTSMVDWLQTHSLTRGRVNFTRQDINQQLALVSSMTREWATIDLSSASDRLSLSLVRSLFRNCEENVLRYLEATRSSHTLLPNGERMELRKFAPMGSATCFPTQSVCFFALCVAAIQLAANIPLHEAARYVRVYGDDIIVPVHYVQQVMLALESVGLRVNRQKSFHRGGFRESCGMFAFLGEEVTPVRFKTAFPRSRADGRGISSWLSYAHECVRRGYYRSAEYIYQLIETLTGPLPAGVADCGYFCRLALSYRAMLVANATWPKRWNETYQRWEIKVLSYHTPFRDVVFDADLHRLHRNLLTTFEDLDPSKMPVGRAGRPKASWRPLD